MFHRKARWAGLGIVLLSVAIHAQESKVPPGTHDASPADQGTASKAVSAKAVKGNKSDGITREQADAILDELRLIRQALQNQQGATAPGNRATETAAAEPSSRVKMKVGKGWYTLGRDDAPVTMVEFTDYQCPFCRRFETDSFAQLKKNLIDTGQLRFVSRDLPLEFHPNAPQAAVAVRCAGAQHKFWEMHDAIMQDTATDLGPVSLIKYGQKINLDMPAFAACLTDKQLVAEIQKDSVDAGTLGISGTPSFVIGKTSADELDGVRIVGAVPYPVFESAIKGMLPHP